MTTHMISTESNKTAETAEMKSDLDNHMSPSLAETATNKQMKTAGCVPNGTLAICGTHGQTKQSSALAEYEKTAIVVHPSRLLTIPPEMRNYICKYAVVEAEPIVVDAKRGFKEPGLLLACKHLRKEAGPVFYHVNKFFLDQQDHNSDMLILWKAKRIAIQKELTIKPMALAINPMQTPSWPNVKVWIDRVYSGEVDIVYPECAKDVCKNDLLMQVQRLSLNLLLLTARVKHHNGTQWEGEVEKVHNVLKGTNMLWT